MTNNKYEDFPNHFHFQVYESSSNSGVKAFEIGKGFIIVKFESDKIYLYNYLKPGKTHVEEMKKKAMSGNKLATYISKNIQKKYFASWNDELGKFERNQK